MFCVRLQLFCKWTIFALIWPDKVYNSLVLRQQQSLHDDDVDVMVTGLTFFVLLELGLERRLVNHDIAGSWHPLDLVQAGQ